MLVREFELVALEDHVEIIDGLMQQGSDIHKKWAIIHENYYVSSSLGKEWRCSYSLYTEKRLIALAWFYKHRPYKEFRLISHKSTGRHVFAEPQCKTRQVVEFINCVNEFHVCYAFHSAFAKPYSMPSGVHIYFSVGLPLFFFTSYMLWDYLSVWPGAKTPISLKETVVAPVG